MVAGNAQNAVSGVGGYMARGVAARIVSWDFAGNATGHRTHKAQFATQKSTQLASGPKYRFY